MDESLVDLYSRVLERALDPDVAASERAAAGRLLHGLAGDLAPGLRTGREIREPLLGDLIRAALRHRIDGV